MKVFTDPVCLTHDPPYEILSGKPVPYLESPRRVLRIKQILLDRGGFDFTDTVDGSIEPLPFISRVHRAEYVRYLESAYDSWVEDGGDKNAVLPETFPHPKLLLAASKTVSVSSPIAKAGLYCFDLSCPITKDTYAAVVASAHVTLSAAKSLVTLLDDAGSTAVFALTRPPGHHAGSSVAGGYCFFNNVAIAVRYFQFLAHKENKDKIAILDIDYHHGNGTQEIFYSDDSVLYVSLHAQNDYPYFTGTSEETGEGEGEGFNVNMPLPRGTGDDDYCSSLSQAAEKIKQFDAKFLIVSLGVDTHEDDPICDFRLTTPCYKRIGGLVSTISRPTLFVMEGGYHMESIGHNVANVLQGFEGVFEQPT